MIAECGLTRRESPERAWAARAETPTQHVWHFAAILPRLQVGAPARLSGGPSPATNIPVVHTLLTAIHTARVINQLLSKCQ